MCIFTVACFLLPQCIWAAEFFSREFQLWTQTRGWGILEGCLIQGRKTLENHRNLVLLDTSLLAFALSFPRHIWILLLIIFLFPLPAPPAVDKGIDYHTEAGLDQIWTSVLSALTWNDSDIRWWPADESSLLSSISFIKVTHCQVQGMRVSHEGFLYIIWRNANKVPQPRVWCSLTPDKPTTSRAHERGTFVSHGQMWEDFSEDFMEEIFGEKSESQAFWG